MQNDPAACNPDQPQQLVEQIKKLGADLGFQQVGITSTNLATDETHLTAWLNKDFHGSMDYMAKHGLKRSRPDLLEPNTSTIISVRMDYLPEPSNKAQAQLDNPAQAYISRYTLGRDYHKVMRKRLQKFAKKIESVIGPFGYRVFVDSAPVLEKAIARNAGLGWIGKHTLLINRDAGSYFFLGEIYTDLVLPADPPNTAENCGKCTSCIDICPTAAIVAPYSLDARKCISYLTIENKHAIPEELRRPIGNRVFGCDDCQLVCPWNRFADTTIEADFLARHDLDSATLLSLFGWDETTFLKNTEGSAIRRLNYERWQRNLAVALGNAPFSDEIISVLTAALSTASEMVAEHIDWAIKEQSEKQL